MLVPRHRVEAELAETVVAGGRAHRATTTFAVLAVLAGGVGSIRLLLPIADNEFERLFFAGLAILVVASIGVVTALASRRELRRLQRKAQVLIDMLEERDRLA